MVLVVSSGMNPHVLYPAHAWLQVANLSLAPVMVTRTLESQLVPTAWEWINSMSMKRDQLSSQPQHIARNPRDCPMMCKGKLV